MMPTVEAVEITELNNTMVSILPIDRGDMCRSEPVGDLTLIKIKVEARHTS
jgi:hypothetical protein